MAERKNFGIMMDPDIHRALKFGAKTAGVTIGEFIENLASSLEFRIRKAYEELEEDRRIPELDGKIISILLNQDAVGDLTENTKRQLKIIKQNQTVSDFCRFDPKITVREK